MAEKEVNLKDIINNPKFEEKLRLYMNEFLSSRSKPLPPDKRFKRSPYDYLVENDLFESHIIKNLFSEMVNGTKLPFPHRIRECIKLLGLQIALEIIEENKLKDNEDGQEENGVKNPNQE